MDLGLLRKPIGHHCEAWWYTGTRHWLWDLEYTHRDVEKINNICGQGLLTRLDTREECGKSVHGMRWSKFHF